MRSTFAPLGLAASLVLSAPAAALAQTTGDASTAAPRALAGAAVGGAFTLGLGAADWDGDYGAKTDTNIAAALLTARYRLGGLRLSASLPWMRIESDGAVFAGVSGTPLILAPGLPVAKRVREGLADLTLGASYLLPLPASAGFDVDLIGRIKLPTAPASSHVSTGRTDYSIGVEVAKPMGRLTPFVSVSHRSFGDLSSLALHDGFATSVGATYIFPNRIAAALSYDFAERASAFVADSHELSGSVSTLLGRSGVRLTAFTSAGLSSGAADGSGGLSLSVSR